MCGSLQKKSARCASLTLDRTTSDGWGRAQADVPTMLPLPFTTFEEIAALGLEVEVSCPSCHHIASADPASQQLRARRFVDVRFRCQQLIQPYTAHPARRCNTLGHLAIRPPADKAIQPGQAVPHAIVSCGSCVPHWEIAQAPRHDPVWKPLWDKIKDARTRIRCPGCGAGLITSWHGGEGIPFTQNYGRVKRSG